jgi:hypothetical protein
MTRILALCLFALLAGGDAVSGFAGEGALPSAPTARLQPSSPGYVALLFYRLTGQQPDFDAWAMASDDYNSANGFDKDLVRREKAAEVTRAYHLITYDDPVVIEHVVTLSSYSRARRGFFVQNFRPDTFFNFEFLGRDYAMVPLDLMDFQWLSLENEKAMEAIDAELKGSNGRALMYLSILPVSADKEKPMTLAGKDYWLLSGRVKRLQIYDMSGKRLLWEGVGRDEAARNQKEVLDLYR